MRKFPVNRLEFKAMKMSSLSFWWSVVSVDYRYLKAFMTPKSTGKEVFAVIHPKPNKTDMNIKRFKYQSKQFHFRKFTPFLARVVAIINWKLPLAFAKRCIFWWLSRNICIWNCISPSRSRCNAFGWNLSNYCLSRIVPEIRAKSGLILILSRTKISKTNKKSTYLSGISSFCARYCCGSQMFAFLHCN